jgi:hypothetical protein
MNTAHTFHVTDRNDNVLADFGEDLFAAMRFMRAEKGPSGKRHVMRSDGDKIASCPRSRARIPRAETLGIRLPEAGINDAELGRLEARVG